MVCGAKVIVAALYLGGWQALGHQGPLAFSFCACMHFATHRWRYNEQSSWDLVAVYYGNSTDWSCSEVGHALAAPAALPLHATRGGGGGGGGLPRFVPTRPVVSAGDVRAAAEAAGCPMGVPWRRGCPPSTTTKPHSCLAARCSACLITPAPVRRLHLVKHLTAVLRCPRKPCSARWRCACPTQ